MKTTRFVLLLGMLAVVSGCSVVRASIAYDSDPLLEISVCSTKAEIESVLGSPDRSIPLPEGGRIDSHTYLVKPKGSQGPAMAAFFAVMTLGVPELIQGGVDVATEATSDGEGCENDAYGTAGCRYYKGRIFTHYIAGQPSERPVCLERKRVRKGAFGGGEDWSSCDIYYRQALSRVIDTSEFPETTAGATMVGLIGIESLGTRDLQLLMAQTAPACQR